MAAVYPRLAHCNPQTATNSLTSGRAKAKLSAHDALLPNKKRLGQSTRCLLINHYARAMVGACFPHPSPPALLLPRPCAPAKMIHTISNYFVSQDLGAAIKRSTLLRCVVSAARLYLLSTKPACLLKTLITGDCWPFVSHNLSFNRPFLAAQRLHVASSRVSVPWINLPTYLQKFSSRAMVSRSLSPPRSPFLLPPS